MTRKGRNFEQLVALLERVLGPQGIRVKSPDYIIGKSGYPREVDISLRSQVGSTAVLVMIECRDRKKRGDVAWVEQVASKREDVKADKAVVVSASGFTKPAERVAKSLGVHLRRVEEVDPAEISLWFLCRDFPVYSRHCEVLKIVPVLQVEPETLDDIQKRIGTKLDVGAPYFRKKDDGSSASLQDVWSTLPSDPLYDGVAPDGPRVRRTVRIQFTEDVRYEMNAGSHRVALDCILAVVDLWVTVEKNPLSAVRLYKSGDQILAQSAEFPFEHEGEKIALEFHRDFSSGSQLISLRKKNRH